MIESISSEKGTAYIPYHRRPLILLEKIVWRLLVDGTTESEVSKANWNRVDSIGLFQGI